MNNILHFFSSLSPYYYIASGIPFLLLVLFFFYFRNIRKRIHREVQQCAELHPAFRPTFTFSLPTRILAAHYGLLKNLSRKYGLNLFVLTGVDDYWIHKLEQKAHTRIFRRALAYSPEKALFTCFNVSLERTKFRPLLREWIDKSGEFMIMRSIARSCNGRRFNGKIALDVYGDYKEELYQMTGDHEWQSRWFAYEILLRDSSHRSVRAVWDAFSDTFYRIRALAAELFSPPETSHSEEEERSASGADSKIRQNLFREIFSLLLDDPEFSVRKTARARIEDDFSDIYKIPDSLSHVQKLHLAEFLNPEIEEDRRFAFLLLDSGDEELAFEAARILSKAGSLTQLFLNVFHEDKTSLNRASELLFHAARVHCTGFLSSLENTTNPGSLILATSVLTTYGDRKHITTLTQKVRGFEEVQKTTAPLRSIYIEALKCVCTRGDDTALHLLSNELSDRRHDKGLQNEVLPSLPVDRSHVYISTLIDFLTSPDYPSTGTLRTLLSRIDPSFTLPHLFTIIKTEHAPYPAKTREEALKVLCELKLPYAVQHVLEHLPLLSLSQAHRYSELISSYNSDTYHARVDYLLTTSDARIRSRIISSLPESFFSVFHDRIVEAIGDPDPEVRSACGWSLMSNGTGVDRETVLSLLHDPVHSVRVETGKAAAQHAAAEQKNTLEKLLRDTNELLPVKRSAIEGLAESRDIESVDILVDRLSGESELEKDILRALSQKTSTSMIKQILSRIKEADPRIRSLLVQSLKKMGESSETVLETLIFDLDSPLRDVTVEILEETGSIDNRIRHLTNRDSTVRREAAAFLSKVATKNAYRGLVLASKDPDEDVRSYVVQALDALDSDKGHPILEELKKDPDRKVRTLTAWALERYTAKRL